MSLCTSHVLGIKTTFRPYPYFEQCFKFKENFVLFFKIFVSSLCKFVLSTVHLFILTRNQENSANNFVIKNFNVK